MHRNLIAQTISITSDRWEKVKTGSGGGRAQLAIGYMLVVTDYNSHVSQGEKPKERKLIGLSVVGK
jgi:hypothetical protein